MPRTEIFDIPKFAAEPIPIAPMANVRIVAEGLSGKPREDAFRELLDLIDVTASRAVNVPEEEINDAIAEAAVAEVMESFNR